MITLVRLTYLAPDIVHAILDGRQPVDLSLTRLMTSTKGLPHGWADQRCYLDFRPPEGAAPKDPHVVRRK